MKEKITKISSEAIKTLTKIHPYLHIIEKIIKKTIPYTYHIKDISLAKKKKTSKKKEQKKESISQKNNIKSKIKINNAIQKKMKKKLKIYRYKFKMGDSEKILKEVMAGVGTTAVAKGLLGSGLLSPLVGVGGGYLIGKWNGVIGSIVGLILPSEKEKFNIPMFSMPYEERKPRYYSKTTGKIINF